MVVGAWATLEVVLTIAESAASRRKVLLKPRAPVVDGIELAAVGV